MCYVSVILVGERNKRFLPTSNPLHPMSTQSIYLVLDGRKVAVASFPSRFLAFDYIRSRIVRSAGQLFGFDDPEVLNLSESLHHSYGTGDISFSGYGLSFDIYAVPFYEG